ncbi:GUN4 domain-containing protein [Phormidium sp. FACHB-592]|uniref:GUN4 domain-containing protein n=1 Tax=Stenomitos frigidus AS-A4 TaxID=2933935 RepID=A0ABV0KIB6_9CYAN|nr:GUN4 domain-containing protein [Phormidium sp. FACHB-592]MBD2075689.1 GUN4 domain-containing protein [Phormidium sp. FACHB-592]
MLKSRWLAGWAALILGLSVIFYWQTRPINYSHLENLLIAKNWKEADQETAQVMLKASDRKWWQSKDENLIERISCNDLQKIDRLWIKHSRGNFGFSVQRPIWERAAKIYASDWDEAFEVFSTQVAWKAANNSYQYPELTFSSNAPQGELPSFYWMMEMTEPGSAWTWQAERLFHRMKACNL